MKLKKFKEKDGKRIGIIVFTITCILLVSGVILYRTFAIFEVRTNQNVIKGTVQDPGNLYFAFYYDGGIQRDMPVKDNGYVLDEEASYCGVNGSKEPNIKVTLTEDYVIQVHGVTTSRTKCNLYFTKGKFIQGKGIPIVEDGDGLYEVSHEDYDGEEAGWKTTELRFAGSNPNNYITFNSEIWRIIGLVNVLTSDNLVEQRLKIIRDDSIGNFSWDHKPSGTGSSTSEYGSNDWTDSQLMEMLNGIYYKSESGNCYIQNGETDSDTCNFDGNDSNTNNSKGLEESARLMIDENIIWNLGRTNDYQYDNVGLVKHWYNYERGTKTYGEMDTIWSKENTKNSTGTEQPDLFHSIGLIYPSDYGYATSGGTTGREYCLTKSPYFWGTVSSSDIAHTQCAGNDWIYKENMDMHTLTSYSSSSFQNFWIRNGGQMIGNNVRDIANIYPTLYLKTNVKIMNDGQDGSYEKPYHLQQIL